MSEIEEIEMIAKFENVDSVVGFVDYEDSGREDSEFEKLYRDYIEYVGWYVLDVKSRESECISKFDDYEVFENPYKSFDRVVPLMDKLGFNFVSVDIEEVYRELVEILKFSYLMRR